MVTINDFKKYALFGWAFENSIIDTADGTVRPTFVNKKLVCLGNRINISPDKFYEEYHIPIFFNYDNGMYYILWEDSEKPEFLRYVFSQDEFGIVNDGYFSVDGLIEDPMTKEIFYKGLYEECSFREFLYVLEVEGENRDGILYFRHEYYKDIKKHLKRFKRALFNYRVLMPIERKLKEDVEVSKEVVEEGLALLKEIKLI